MQENFHRKKNPNFQNVASLILPTNMSISANQGDKKTNIDIEYKSIAVDESFNFPYSVPEGYERIFIK